MGLLASDIKWKLSTKNGTAGNQNGSTPAESLGKYISTTEIANAELNNLFDSVTGEENAASDVEYRCLFIHNNHATLDLQNVRIWLSAQGSGGAGILIASTDIGLPNDFTKPVGQAGAQSEEIADESTSPGSPAFGGPTTKGIGLQVNSPSTLEAGYCIGIWLKRTATDSAAKMNDSVTIKIEGDTTG